MTIAISGTTGITLDGQFNSASSMGFKNRIINGAMVIDQRNAGASVSVDNNNDLYTLDRFACGDNTDGAFTCQQVSTAPVGFSKSLKATVSSTDSSLAAGQFARIYQYIEGSNITDLGWGAAGASTVTLSFWVQSSVTGTFSGALSNSAFDRSYPFTYTINSANTWEQKTVTIAGDTSGTWLTTTGIGIRVFFSLGCGSTFSGTAGAWAGATYLAATGQVNWMETSGATFYITGVQLEKGSTATSFDYRPYGTELALCQRYYYLHASNTPFNIGAGFYFSSTYATALIYFPVSMRVVPVLVQSTGTNYYGIYANSALDTFDSFNSGIAQPSTQSCGIEVSTGVSGTAGQAGRVVTNNASASIAFNSEL
jgi:hypothetical protein